MFKPGRFLVPVDFSQESELALEWAIMTAKTNRESSIHLLHVLHIHIVAPGRDSGPVNYLDIEREVAEKRLREWQARIPEGILAFSVVKEGSVSEEITALCAERGIELVIMTTHGRRGLSHMLHGSVAEETVRLAACPVLVLHLNQAAVVAAHSTA